MNANTRERSTVSNIMRSLHNRSRLTLADRYYHEALEKGYIGEQQFDALVESLTCDHIYLKDLRLKYYRKTFQIDSLLLVGNKAYIYEVKNYEGEYEIKGDRLLLSSTKVEVPDPMVQLQRSMSLFRQLLHHFQLPIDVEGYVIFINEKMALHNMPKSQYLLKSMTVKQLEAINKTTEKVSQKNKRLAKHLLASLQEEKPYDDLPDYSFETMKKGMLCKHCFGQLERLSMRRSFCQRCRQTEDLSESIYRSIVEFRDLFPEKKLTTKIIHEWCGSIPSTYMVTQVLKKHYNRHKRHRWTYFE